MAYVGQKVTIPLGGFGLLTDLPPGQIPPGALIKAFNVSYETGLITKAPGSLRYNLAALPSSIVALHDWWPNTTTQRLIAACANGSIYKDIGDREFSGSIAINSGYSSLTPQSFFVEGGQETAGRDKKLFFFSRENQVQVLTGDGAAFEVINSPAVDWTTTKYPKFGFVHRNRLWAFMGQRAYASTTGDHEDFTSGTILTQNIYPGEGGELLGGFVFKGRAFTFKEGGFVYYLDDSDPDSDNWNWRKLASNFGLASPHGICEIINDMVAVNESGSPTSYAATDSLGDIESADILRLLQIENYFRSVTSINGLDNLHALYYAAKKQAFFTWRTSYRTTNDCLLMLDFNKDSTRAAIWTKDSAECLALRRDSATRELKPIYGSSDGYVYLMDREDRLVGGSAYTGEFKTGHLDFGDPSKNKIYDNLAVEFMPMGSWDLSIDVYIDGTFSETINFTMDVRDDGLDSFTLDTDPLGREETQTIQKPLHGSGRRISFHCRQSGSNQNFALASITIGFRTSAEQATRV